MSKRFRVPLLMSSLVGLMALLSWAAGERAVDSADTNTFAYLPIGLNSYCAPYADDFSNPDSGWFRGEDSTGQFSDYSNGEYQLWGPSDNATLSVRLAPTCAAINYSVETRAHIIRETKGRYYGILFGAVDEVTPLYSFVVFPQPHESPNLPTWVLVYADPTNILNTEPIQQGAANMNPGDTITLKVVRNGTNITAFINGVQVASVTDARIGGLTMAGLASGKDPREAGAYAAGFDYFIKESLR
jgi:hypothetical protein